MGMRGQLQAPTALFPRRAPPPPGTHCTECASKPVRSFWRTDKSLDSAGNGTKISPSTGRTQYSDYAVGCKNELRYITGLFGTTFRQALKPNSTAHPRLHRQSDNCPAFNGEIKNPRIFHLNSTCVIPVGGLKAGTTLLSLHCINSVNAELQSRRPLRVKAPMPEFNHSH